MAEDLYALVTGAGKGIGKAIATGLAERGHNIILSSLPGENLDVLCSVLSEKYHIKAQYFEIDLATKEGPESLFRKTKENGLRVNILINNAGIGIEGPMETYSQKIIDSMILLNIRALTLLTFYFTPELKKRPSYLLNISSFGCYTPTAYKTVYLATKSYIYYLTRALGSEFNGTSVKTCLVIPSAVRTNELTNKRIARAGWLARASVLDPEDVASKILNDMFKGRKVVIPGRINRFIFGISALVPEGIIMAAVRNLFRSEEAL
ncbi:MAG TPA: SDR family NAD(P)-dependent oxidoreductase [Bacteroidales bacterium]|nr:SDR family NAD(P)-dependent oxidoreductase [Bacteroidales bacterium]